MAMNLNSCEHADDEEYIDMEVTSYSKLFVPSITSPNHPREFEFQMSSKSLEKESTTSPADELFYKGQLLPLHLPPRLQMVEKLLENTANSVFDYKMDTFLEFFSTPLTTTPTTTSTPFESCSVTPCESFRISKELTPEMYFSDNSTISSRVMENHPKKSWTRKLKLIKQTSFGSKLKASRTYLKNLFSKSGCSEESSTSAAKNMDEQAVSRARESSSKYISAAKKIPFGQIHNKTSYQIKKGNIDKENIPRDAISNHRRSFSGIIKRHLTIKSSCSSSSISDSSLSVCSSGSNEFHEVRRCLKKSNSVKAEIENPIQGAIAHCKESQQPIRTRKTLSEVGFCSFSAVC